MRKIVAFLLIAVTTLCAIEASAQTLKPPKKTTLSWTASTATSHIFFGTLASVVIGAFGAIGGVYASSALSSCDTNEKGACSDAFRAGLGGGFVIGTVLGATMGVGLTGKAQDFGGNSYGALAGASVAGLPSALLLFNTENLLVSLIVSSVLPAIGATAGYYLTLDDPKTSRRRSGAMIDIDDHRVTLTVPNVSLHKSERETRFDVPILGGAF